MSVSEPFHSEWQTIVSCILGMAPPSVELPRVILDTSMPPPSYQGPPQQPPPSLGKWFLINGRKV